MSRCFYVVLTLLLLNTSSLQAQQKYVVTRVGQPITVDGDWEKTVWRNIDAIDLDHYMGEKPNHFPGVQAKVAYDDRYIYVIWKVDDQFIKAVAKKHQDPVFQDSCVEFFFSPSASVEQGYFNLETNCGGTMLFKQRSGTDQPFVEIAPKHLDQLKISGSMPKRITKEIKEKTTWYLEYAIPFDMLGAYYEMDAPVSGSTWRANFYKCADKTSQPHWLTWSPVDHPTPKFHLPEYFGTLVFE